MKWNSSQIKYKSKKGNDTTVKSPQSKYTSYSSKRPKSAKGNGVNPKPEYSYKYSYSKGTSHSKYGVSTKKGSDISSQLRKSQAMKDITTKSK